MNKNNANKWRFPSIEYCNMRKEFPNMSSGCFKKLFDFKRRWFGRLWYISFKHHQFTIDFRKCFLSDMVFPPSS